ncbi:hypothetical protein HUT18_26875 [Streptomyces sp. NA04227]|uniref:hypothetical protein n=1 Tax=Streptomyces sp. NA04227 TaxID=2742136 RepID=UPI00158FAC74|nr:hypothetical protein [Streptomyces sp. NA04227]QKW09475.1 hypothetical protein HUT18_26875 [Streptomyces sp. NA04227]
MLALRLARGARPLVQLRRALLATASAGTGFLLLCALGWAMGHPASATEAALRLAWCAVPLAATVHYALAVARTDPGVRPRSALSAAGLGPSGLALLAAVSAGVACALGSALALFLFLLLRGDLPSLPYSGAASGLLAHDRPLPLAAIGTLLLVTPVAVGAACRLALRARSRGAEAAADDDEAPAPDSAPAGLPWGVALLAAGLAVEAYTHGSPDTSALVPGALADSPAGVVGGWALTTVGLVLAGPGLAYQCGRALQAVRPGAMRLLAGRVLQQEAARVGRPLGVLCAVASAGFAAATLYTDRGPGPGPLGALGALLVAVCALAALLTAVAEARQEREPFRAALLDLGAAPTLLRGAVLLRAGTLLAVFGPVTWLVAVLAALPLT